MHIQTYSYLFKAPHKFPKNNTIFFFYHSPFIENEYNKLRKKVIDDLIKENEMYINNQKETLYKFEDPNLKVTQTNNECFYDENKIYKCLKNMNQSTSNFVNLYSRCCRYLRNYESCVQKIKI